MTVISVVTIINLWDILSKEKQKFVKHSKGNSVKISNKDNFMNSSQELSPYKFRSRINASKALSLTAVGNGKEFLMMPKVLCSTTNLSTPKKVNSNQT